jgi:hypothetical protein
MAGWRNGKRTTLRTLRGKLLEGSNPFSATMNKLEYYLSNNLWEPRLEQVLRFHEDHVNLINRAKGSTSKHQAWEGGYRHHIEQCIEIGLSLYSIYHRHVHDLFTQEQVVTVLYFHDIEKIWKGVKESHITLQPSFKILYYTQILPELYGIVFSEDELTALKYIHGEGHDYCEDRVMNELGALCHAADVLSARLFHDKREI